MRTNKKRANIRYNGLDVNCEITSKDPLDQVFYAGSNTYIPNRMLTPLVLMPSLEVVDITGLKVGTAFTKASWYVGEIADKNLITSRVTTDEFYLDGLNLIVKKNLDNPIQVSFLGEFLDKRTNKAIQVPKVVELSVLSTSEIAPAPTIGIDRPADWSHNPISDKSIQTLTASVFVNEKAYQSAAKWLVEFNGKKEAIDLFDCYVSGQNSNKLVLDTDRLPSGALIYAENLSEEEYNKAYGINPDWDDRMSEVFENRNLALNTQDINSSYYNVWRSLVTMDWANDTDYIISVDVTNPLANTYLILFVDGKERASINNLKDGVNSQTFKAISTQGRGVELFAKIGGVDNNKPFHINSIKITKSAIATPYTPAPEDLNYRNLCLNGDLSMGDIGYAGWNSDLYFTNNNIRVIPKYPALGQAWNTNKFRVLDKGYNFAIVHIANCIDLEFIELKWGISAYSLENRIQRIDNPKGDVILMGAYTSDGINTTSRFNMVQASPTTDKGEFTIKSMMLLNSKHIIEDDDINAILNQIALSMPYIPAPQDYAPDGIIQGEYSTHVPFFVKYPALDVDVADFGDILEEQANQTFYAEVLYNKGLINNPSQFLDIKFILGDDAAGGKDEEFGTGNSATIATSKLHGNKYIALDWEFKSRPQDLTKN